MRNAYKNNNNVYEYNILVKIENGVMENCYGWREQLII